MSEKQQTAVEWFASQIKGGQLITNQKFKELLEQAKEMEKKQIIDAYRNGKNQQLENSGNYYSKTYSK